MKLVEAKAQLFRNIVDSNAIQMEEDIVCLVGKNESGKTALLDALYSLKPAMPNTVNVDLTVDYPRWRKKTDERKGDISKVAYIQTVFSLEEDDLAELESVMSVPLPEGTLVRASRTYAGGIRIGLGIDEASLVVELAERGYLDQVLGKSDPVPETIQVVADLVSSQMTGIDKRSRASKDLTELKSLLDEASAIAQGKGLSEELRQQLYDLVPTFFYFSQYSILEGRIDLTNLIDKPKDQLTVSEQTARALLDLVQVSGKEFMESEIEIRIAELEAAANDITQQIFEYWTQNTDLIVGLSTDPRTVSGPEGQTVVHRFLDIRLNDQRHQMTTNFATRSTGFQWFFSFIVAFTKFEGDKDVIVLLDEPGVGLHARAQADFLRFIEEKLSSSGKVIYTSHSPFTVNSKHLERVRLVEDLTSMENRDVGAKVSADVLDVRGDTLFPLQAALGYDIAQNLFVGGYNLVVEGPSDLVYLMTLSEHLEDLGKSYLDPRFTIVPVGGADKIPTFAALLGAHVDVSVLVDSRASTNQKLQDMISKGLLEKQRLINVGQIVSVTNANIEDLFTPGEYLRLYNPAFNSSIKVGDLKGSDSIVLRIERHRGREYSHLRPATEILTKRDTHLGQLTEGTTDRFEKLIELLNSSLPVED